MLRNSTRLARAQGHGSEAARGLNPPGRVCCGVMEGLDHFLWISLLVSP